MYTTGIYRDENQGIHTLKVYHSKSDIEVLICDGYNVQSAYWSNGLVSKCAINKDARIVANIIKTALSKCTNKNMSVVPFDLGTATVHNFTHKKVEYQVMRYNTKELCGFYVDSENLGIELSYDKTMTEQLFKSLTGHLQYIELKSQELSLKNDNDEEEDNIPTRSLEEIGLEKDITWLKDKKYYVVNDDAVAEQIFTILDNSNCVIAYDTETTGLRINIFSKINSKEQKELQEYNKDKPKSERIKADKLTGIIFCVEDNVSYYFPVDNKKFKNLYETNTETRNKLVNNFKAEYTVGGKRGLTGDIARYWRETPAEQITSDVILMERCRNILTTKHLVAHNGSFEWKVSYCYDIDIKLCDDTMIMHQLMYKFRSTTSNRGEPSNLKYLTKRELGIDQLDLHDFFVGYKEDTDGLVKGKKKKSKIDIDFSYMSLEGAEAYAPADGDTTLQLFKIYKKDLVENHKELVYLYQIEIIVACAIGYMEFYGLKLDEERINDVCEDKKTELLEKELEFRRLVKYSSEKEEELRGELDRLKDELSTIVKIENGLSGECRDLKFSLIKDSSNNQLSDEYNTKLSELQQVKQEKYNKQEEISKHRDKITEAIESSGKVINLGSPPQVATLFFDELGIECSEEKRTVNKKAIKALRKLKNEDKSLKYPMVEVYAQWKDTSTLITKFFDKLPQFMFPGGFIFPSFGQISTATGRMSCIDENTPISLIGTTKAIKDVQAGDIAYSFNKNCDLKIDIVKRKIDQGYKECIEVYWESEDNKGSLICTPDHKIRLKNGSWVTADALKTGDKVLNYTDEGNRDYTIVKSESVGTRHVYDLEMYKYHNFIAGGINVHNCSKPNAQQFCKAVTGLVVPRDNNILIDADFSQIEYRTLVAMADEQSLIDKFRDPDSDYHTTMASLMYGVPYASVTKQMRGDAKSFNFGIPYGMGFKSLAILIYGSADEKHKQEAREKYELYFKEQPNVRAFFERVKESALVYKFTETLWHRRRYYSFNNADGSIDDSKKAYAQRQAGNALIQGCIIGDTLIQTKEYGITKIKDIVNKHLLVWDGDKWSNGDILYSGKKQKCMVTFDNKQQFICSPIHKFLIKDDANDINSYLECKNLTKGTVVKINNSSELRIADYEGHKQGLTVKSVEITDEWIDMYDVCNTDGGYYVADGIITHNTAADIFKISVARNFSFIRQYGLLGKLLIINMVHDEQLMEVDCNTLNPLAIYKHIAENMQFELEGFPPLFIGAGFGFNWKYAKGGDAEIHPDLCKQLCKEAEGMSVFTSKPLSANDVFNYFQGRVDSFRLEKVKTYLCDKKNWGNKLHPVIGSLITGNFTYGLKKEVNEEEPENGESDEHYLNRLLEQFIEKHNLPVKAEYFLANETVVEEEEDKEYFDDEEDDLDEFEIDDSEFALVDEDESLYGANIIDLINQFGYFVSIQKRVCGIKVAGMSKSKIKKVAEYLNSKVVEPSTPSSMEICFLKDGNLLTRTGVYVANIDATSVKDIMNK